MHTSPRPRKADTGIPDEIKKMIDAQQLAPESFIRQIEQTRATLLEQKQQIESKSDPAVEKAIESSGKPREEVLKTLDEQIKTLDDQLKRFKGN